MLRNLFYLNSFKKLMQKNFSSYHPQRVRPKSLASLKVTVFTSVEQFVNRLQFIFNGNSH